MAYGTPIVRSLKAGRRNVIGIVAVSAAFSAAWFPFVSSIALGGGGWIAGLWTSSLLVGIVLFGAMAYAAEVATRDARIPVSAFGDGIVANWKRGLGVGVVTFAVAVVGSFLLQLPADTLPETAVRVFGAYLLVQYYVLAGFALSAYALDGGSLREAVSEAVRLVVVRPDYAVWYVLQVAGWTFLAALTLVSVAILLPGYLAVLSTAFVVHLRSEG